MIVHLDVETRSDIDLITRGAFVYFESPNTRVLIAAYRIDDGPLKIWTCLDNEPPYDLWAAIEAGATIKAWNAQFELLACEMLADRHGWPRPRLEQFRDTMAAAAAMALPRGLDTKGAKTGCAEALGLKVRKDKEGTRLINKFSKPRRVRKDEPDGLYFHEPEDHPDDFRKFAEYCGQDVVVEEAVDSRLVPLSDSEQDFWVLNERINRRGLRIDITSAQSAIRLADKAKKALDREMKEVTEGGVKACSQVAKLVEWVNQQGVAMESADKTTIANLLAADDIPDRVKRALELRQEAAKTSVSKLQGFLKRVSSDGRLRGAYNYHAASTGRSQSSGVNFNNLPRPREIYDESKVRTDVLFKTFRTEDPELLKQFYGPELGRPLHLIADAIRGFIWAAPGYDLLQADYSGIEGAVIAWLAEERWKLDALFEILEDPSNPDMYRRTAAMIMGMSTDVITKKHPYRQQVGKPAELGLGFGGGVPAFHDFAIVYDVDLNLIVDPVFSVVEPERLAKAERRYENQLKRGQSRTDILPRNVWIACEIVKHLWREANPAIVQMWRDLEDAVRSAVMHPGTITEAGKVQYVVKNGFLWALLPSNRCLAYAAPRLKDQVWARVWIGPNEWSDPEVMDRDEAERGERMGLVQIEGRTSAKVTVMGVDSTTKKWRRYGLYGGLIAENCLSAVTEVLTPSGWKRITDIQTTDKLWDGLEWVSHGGVVSHGVQPTVDLAGVRATPDHKFWTDEGWIDAANANTEAVETASPDPEIDREAVREAGRDQVRRLGWKEKPLAGPMRLRHDEIVRRFGTNQRPDNQLWMLSLGSRVQTANHAWHVQARCLCGLEQHARSLQSAITCGLRAVWRARDCSLRALAQLSKFLDRHGPLLAEGFDYRKAGQPKGLQPGKLRVARPETPVPKQAEQQLYRNAEGSDAHMRGGGDDGHKLDDVSIPSRCGLAGERYVPATRQRPSRRVEPVFDILNAGPRHRFTVRGTNGPVIVSNCTQAVARDLLKSGMEKAEAAGYPIIGTVYDEIFAEVPRGFGDLEAFERMICELPAWAEGMPLAAGGWRGKRYRKD